MIRRFIKVVAMQGASQASLSFVDSEDHSLHQIHGASYTVQRVRISTRESSMRSSRFSDDLSTINILKPVGFVILCLNTDLLSELREDMIHELPTRAILSLVAVIYLLISQRQWLLCGAVEWLLRET
jgi:hypothetical protein